MWTVKQDQRIAIHHSVDVACPHPRGWRLLLTWRHLFRIALKSRLLFIHLFLFFLPQTRLFTVRRQPCVLISWSCVALCRHGLAPDCLLPNLPHRAHSLEIVLHLSEGVHDFNWFCLARDLLNIGVLQVASVSSWKRPRT